MRIIKCDACGANELKRIGNMYQCSFCGSKYILDESDNLVDKELTEAKIITLLEDSRKLHGLHKYAEELNVLIKALEMDENNANTIIRLGRCYRCLNIPDKAIECYEKTLELNPNEGSAYTNIGTIYILRENYEDAARCYEKGLPIINKATYDYWVAYANYAVAVARLGNPKEAEKMIKEAETHGYKNGDTIRKMAGIKAKPLASRIRKLFS